MAFTKIVFKFVRFTGSPPIDNTTSPCARILNANTRRSDRIPTTLRGIIYKFLLRTAIVRSLTGYSDIMRMTFQDTCIRDAGKFGIVQLLYIGSATVSHTCTKTAYQLIDYFIQSTFIRNTGCNTFRNQFLHISSSTLEITVFRAILHSAAIL